MAEKHVNKVIIKRFILLTKVLPILIAIIHLINTIISFFHGNDIPLNYIGGVSLLPLVYLYIASYTFQLCSYYRMFLHYSVIINIINIYDYYFEIPVNDLTYLLIIIAITIITMILIIYLKFFKCDS